MRKGPRFGGGFVALCGALLLGTALSARADTVAYYRFETGRGHTSIIDSSGNNLNGSIFSGAPTYSTDVGVTQIPQTGQVNKFSMNFDGSSAASFAYPFPLDTPNDATLELWLKPNADEEWDFLWTTTEGGDQNRYNGLRKRSMH
jgi:hypothetical protein